MTLLGIIQTFDALDLSTSSIAQDGPLMDYDIAIDRTIYMADGRKFDGDGGLRSTIRPGMTIATFRLSGATAEAVNLLIDTIKAKEGVSGALSAIAPSVSTDVTYNCVARCLAVRSGRMLRRPMVRNYKQVYYLELEWDKVSVWVRA